MDLNNIKTNSDSIVKLRLPDGTGITNNDGTRMTVSVDGLYSDTYRHAVEAQQRERVKRAQANGGKLVLTPAEVIDDRIDLVASCVRSWNITLNNTCPECTKDNVLDLFKKYPFIYEQVNAALEDAQSFLEIQSNS